MATGTAMQMLPMLQMLTPALKQLKNITGMVTMFGRVAGTVFKVAGMAVKFFSGPIGWATLAIGALTAGIKIYNKEMAETRRENAMLNGITKKGAAEAGISYESMTEKLERVNAELKIQREKGLLAYEASTSSGVSGLTVTIAQLKELKKTAKETMPELMATLEVSRELDYAEKKFLAAIQGVDLDGDKNENKGQKEWEDMKARVFSGGATSDGNDVLSLQGPKAQQLGFGIGMGLDYEDFTKN